MEGWYCKGCYSLNRPRADHCYKCGERGGMTESVLPVATNWWQASPSQVEVPVDATGQFAVRTQVITYRPADRLAWAVIVLLGLSVAVTAAIDLVIGTSSISPLDIATLVGPAGAAVADLSMVRLLLWVLTPIAWFIWFDRVLQNVEVVGGGRPEMSRGGAIGWWFVPAASLWKPVRAVEDVYRRLAVPGTPGGWLLALWWMCWIGASYVPLVGGFVVGFVAGARNTPLERVLQSAVALEYIGDALEVAAGVFAIGLVLAIQRAQRARTAPPDADVPPDLSTRPDAASALVARSRPGALPAASLILAGAVIASGLFASAAVAQGRGSLSGPSSGPREDAAATLTPIATPSPSPTPSPTAVPTDTWTAADHLHDLVLEHGDAYSGHIAIDGTMRLTSAGSTVSGRVTGTVGFSDHDFEGHERSRLPGTTEDLAVLRAAGRVFVSRGGVWSRVTALPDTFAVDPLGELLWSHRLEDVTRPEDDDLVRLRWPLFEAGFASGFARTMTGDWRTTSMRAEVLVTEDGEPDRIEIEIEGHTTDAGVRVDIRMDVTYTYRDVGEPVDIEAPTKS